MRPKCNISKLFTVHCLLITDSYKKNRPTRENSCQSVGEDRPNFSQLYFLAGAALTSSNSLSAKLLVFSPPALPLKPW